MNLNSHSFSVSALNVNEKASHLIQYYYDYSFILMVNNIKIADTIQNRKINAMQDYTDEQITVLSERILYIIEHSPHGGWVKKLQTKYPEYIDFLNWRYPQLEGRLLKTKINWLKHNRLDFPICPTCGNKYGQHIDINVNDDYPSHCSCRCTQLDKFVREKNRATNLDRYGCANASQSKQIQQKIRQTCIDKYGVDNVFKSSIFKEKIKNYNLERYGVENCHQRLDVIEKTKKTNLIKYGSVIPSGFKSNNISMGEIELYELCKSIYSGEIVTNDRMALGGMELDIWFPEIKAGIEYDGDFWHNLPKMKKRDQLKDILCNRKGIKLLRISEHNFKHDRDECINKIKKFLNIKE